MTARRTVILVGASALALQVGTAAAEGTFGEPKEAFGKGRHGLLHPRVCERLHLSDETRAWCAGIAGLRGRDRYKAIVLENLRRTNQPPVVAIEILQVLPRRIDVSAEVSTDEDGFPELHYFSLEDADTGDPLAGPIISKEPVASLETNEDLPQDVRVIVTVEDDLRAIDTAEQIVPLAATNCSNELFSCSTGALGNTTCSPSSNNKVFTTDDLLDAAQRCDRTLTKSTPLRITARGGSGGRGANVWPENGGAGGEGGSARMVTTLAELDRVYKSPQEGTTYCYGIGQQGGHANTESGAGGAATLLRTCQNVSQTAVTGVLLIAGGGGGGKAANFLAPGRDGSAGGSAASGAGGAASGPGRGGGRGGGGGEGGSNAGQDGVGGKGGTTGWGTAAWSRGNPRVEGDAGQGGKDPSPPCGAGGGGWGGGGCRDSNGGGGGGSYAATGLAQATNAGISKGQGSLEFRFQP